MLVAVGGIGLDGEAVETPAPTDEPAVEVSGDALHLSVAEPQNARGLNSSDVVLTLRVWLGGNRCDVVLSGCGRTHFGRGCGKLGL